METVTYKEFGLSVSWWDVGGNPKVRRFSRHTMVDADALVFVVDGTAPEQLPEARDYLATLLSLPEAPDSTPVVIVVNDKSACGGTCLSVAEVTRRLELHKLTVDRQWWICGTNAAFPRRDKTPAFDDTLKQLWQYLSATPEAVMKKAARKVGSSHWHYPPELPWGVEECPLSRSVTGCCGCRPCRDRVVVDAANTAMNSISDGVADELTPPENLHAWFWHGAELDARTRRWAGAALPPDDEAATYRVWKHRLVDSAKCYAQRKGATIIPVPPLSTGGTALWPEAAGGAGSDAAFDDPTKGRMADDEPQKPTANCFDKDGCGQAPSAIPEPLDPSPAELGLDAVQRLERLTSSDAIIGAFLDLEQAMSQHTAVVQREVLISSAKKARSRVGDQAWTPDVAKAFANVLRAATAHSGA